MRMMKHDKKDDNDDCDGDEDEDKDEDKNKYKMRRTKTRKSIMTMATMATIIALTASGKQQDSYDVRSHPRRTMKHNENNKTDKHA